MKQAKLFVVMAIIFSVIAGCSAGSFADMGDGGEGGGEERIIHRYHHYFIPYQPEAVNCYGVYRILSNYTHQQFGVDVGTKKHQRKDFGANKIVNFTQKSAFYSNFSDIVRGDMLVLTDFAVRAQRTDVHHRGNEIIYDHYTFYYETPRVVLGETVITSPLFGAETIDEQDRTLIVIDRNLMKKYIREISDADFLKVLLPQFDGANPRGALIRSKWLSSTKEIGVLTLTKDHAVSVGWWDLFSQAVLKHIDDIKKNPQKYFGSPLAEDLSSLNAMQEFIKEQDKQYHVPPSASPLMNVSWSDIKAFYIKDVLDDYVYKTLTDSLKGNVGWIYRYSKFLRSDEINNTWENEAAKIANTVWAKAYKAGNTNEAESQSVSIGKTFASYTANMGTNEDEYTGAALDIVVSAPWGEDATDYLVPGHIGFWSSKEPFNKYNFCDDFVFMNSDANYLGRWLWQKAQLILFDEGKSKWLVRSKNDGEAWSTLAEGNPEKMYSLLVGIKKKNFEWTEPYSPMLRNEDSVWKAVYDFDRDFWKTMFPYMSLNFHPVFADVFDKLPDLISWENALQRSYAPQVYSSWGDDFSTTRPTIQADIGKLKEIANSYISPLLGSDSNTYISAFKKDNNNMSNDALTSIKTTYANKQRYSVASQANVVSVPAHGKEIIKWLQTEWFLKDLFNKKILTLPDLTLHETLWAHWPVGKDIKTGNGIPNW